MHAGTRGGGVQGDTGGCTGSGQIRKGDVGGGQGEINRQLNRKAAKGEVREEQGLPERRKCRETHHAGTTPKGNSVLLSLCSLGKSSLGTCTRHWGQNGKMEPEQAPVCKILQSGGKGSPKPRARLGSQGQDSSKGQRDGGALRTHHGRMWPQLESAGG